MALVVGVLGGVLGGSACSTSAPLSGTGGSCLQATDCQEGLVCVYPKNGRNYCTADAAAIEFTEEAGPDSASMKQNGDATAPSDGGGGDDAPVPVDGGAADGGAGDAAPADASKPKDAAPPPADSAPPMDASVADTAPPVDAAPPPVDASSVGDATTD